MQRNEQMLLRILFSFEGPAFLHQDSITEIRKERVLVYEAALKAVVLPILQDGKI
jgi:hypothetical protein